MAQIEVRKNVDGEITGYRVKVYLGRDEHYKRVTRSCILPRPEGLTPKKEEKEIARQADAWEQEIKAEYDNNNDMPAIPPVGMWFHYNAVNEFMHEWMVHKQELADGEITPDEYLEWKLNWPDTCCESGPSCQPCEPKIKWKKWDPDTES